MQLDYARMKSHHIVGRAKGVNSTLKDQKKGHQQPMLYYLCHTKFLKRVYNPMSKVDKLFQILKGLGTQRSVYDEAKYVNHFVDELMMDFYL